MEKYVYKTTFKVPFSDIDMMGHLNNAKYLTYFETARTNMLFDFFGGFPRDGVSIIIAHAEIDYKSPGRWNDELTIKVRPTSVGTTSFVYEYEVTNQRGMLVAQGKTVQVTYDYAKGTSIPIPEKARDMLEKQIEDTRDKA